jgi:hypothetical protein
MDQLKAPARPWADRSAAKRRAEAAPVEEEEEEEEEAAAAAADGAGDREAWVDGSDEAQRFAEREVPFTGSRRSKFSVVSNVMTSLGLTTNQKAVVLLAMVVGAWFLPTERAAQRRSRRRQQPRRG